MEAYGVLIVKCLTVYVILIIALRLMGKREVGELSVFDIVIYLLMSELLAISIAEPKVHVMKSIVPIITLVIIQISISYALLKWKWLRDLVDGNSVIVIDHGKINQEAMRKNRYNIDDLMCQLRINGISTPSEVAYAVLENNGQLSVLSMNACKVAYPHPIIYDGVINHKVLMDINKDEQWLRSCLRKQGIQDVEDVFLCILEKRGFYIIKKHHL